MELRYLRYFVTVAGHQNFTRAAEELRIAQPAISQQIKTLEDELGVALLLRTTRSVKLTAAGHAFLPEARAILAHAERSKLVAKRAAHGEIGSLSIGCFGSAVAAFLPELLREYRRTFPAVRVHLLELTPGEQLEAFAREQIDLGFTRALPRELAKGFGQQRIYRDRLMLAVPEAHASADAKVVRLETLADEDFVMFKRSGAPELVDAMTGLCGRAGFSPRVVSEPSMMSSVLLSVAAGVGLALVPGCTRRLGQAGVRFKALRPASPVIDLMLVHPKGDVPPTVAAFRDLLGTKLAEIRAKMDAPE